MFKISENQFLDLCNLYKRPLPLLREDRTDIDRLKEWGLIALKPGEWSLTERGRSFIDGKGLELAKPDFGNLTASEKKAIIATGIFPERDRRRLMFDRTESVAMCAINYFDLTEEEFIRLGDSPSPTVRATALSLGREHLRNGEDLDGKLSNYLKHDDKTTVVAILKVLNATGNAAFVGEDLVGRWLRSDIPEHEVLSMLRESGTEVPDGTITALLDEGDPDALTVMSEFLLDRLDPAQFDAILDKAPLTALANIAHYADELVLAQLKRLMEDNPGILCWIAAERLLRFEPV